MPLTFLFRPARDGTGAQAPDIELQFADAPVRIGRSATCDLVLPHPSISELHAIARPAEGGGWEVAEQASRNGTWINGTRLAPKASRALRDGDHVRVGAVWLQARIAAAPVANRTTRELALEIVSRFLGSQVPSVQVVEGPDRGEQLSLAEEQRAYVIGRSSRCDLPLVDLGASREHVRLVRQGNEVVITDLGTKNGILMGDTRIGPRQVVRWPASLDVRLGDTVLALQLPASLESVSTNVAAEQAPPPTVASVSESEVPGQVDTSTRREELPVPEPRANAPALPDTPATFALQPGAGAPPAAIPSAERKGMSKPASRHLEVVLVVAGAVIGLLAIAAVLWLLLS